MTGALLTWSQASKGCVQSLQVQVGQCSQTLGHCFFHGFSFPVCLSQQPCPSALRGCAPQPSEVTCSSSGDPCKVGPRPVCSLSVSSSRALGTCLLPGGRSYGRPWDTLYFLLWDTGGFLSFLLASPFKDFPSSAEAGPHKQHDKALCLQHELCSCHFMTLITCPPKSGWGRNTECPFQEGPSEDRGADQQEVPLPAQAKYPPPALWAKSCTGPRGQ